MNKIFLLFSGGGIGTLLRFTISGWTNKQFGQEFPFGTLAVNLIGCLIIGALAGINEKGFLEEEMKLLLFTGLLGGFTTFSSFSLESVQLLRNGQLFQFITYVVISNLGGLALAYSGFLLFKSRA